MKGALSPPEPLGDHHEVGDFDSGEPALDGWLKRRARANQVSGASRTYVVSHDKRVIAYYALASGAVTVDTAAGRFRRNMPDPIPVAVLARLAVDRAWHRQGIGRALFRDAALRVTNAADAIGIRGTVVHAIAEEAKSFYLALGFAQPPGAGDADGDAPGYSHHPGRGGRNMIIACEFSRVI